MKIGVVGVGMWGRNHVKTLHEMGHLGVVVEMNDDLRAAAQDEFPDVPCVFSLKEALEIDAVEGYVVATPAQTHADISMELFAGGKHVLVEKPMTLNSEDAERIIAAAEDAGKILMVGHLLLFQPAVQFVRSFIAEGRLGKVFTLTQRRSKLGRARSVENVLWSFGVHDVAVLLYLVGRAPSSVSASGHAAITEGVEDDVHLHLNFDDDGAEGSGILANLHNSWLWPRVERELIVTGEAGILIYDELNQKVIFQRKGIERKSLQNIDDGEEVVFEGADQPLRLELQHFIDCCRSGETPIACGQGGLDVVKVLESVS